MLTITTKQDFMDQLNLKTKLNIGFINHFLSYMRFIKSGKVDLIIDIKIKNNLISFNYKDLTGINLSKSIRYGGAFTDLKLNTFWLPGLFVVEMPIQHPEKQLSINLTELLDYRDGFHGIDNISKILYSLNLESIFLGVIYEVLENFMVHGYAKQFNLKKIDACFIEILLGRHKTYYYLDVLEEQWFKDEYLFITN